MSSSTTMPSRRWLFDDAHPAPPATDDEIARCYLADETATVRELVAAATLPEARTARIQKLAVELVEAIRRRRQRAPGVDALLSEYDLSSAEGVVLMCLAEALLRIPDAATADRLIADKLGGADWRAHVGQSDSLFVNASTWALLLTGKILRPAEVAEPPTKFLARLAERLGEPIVRAALRQAMRILGQQFVMGETIEAALDRALRAPQFDYSFDMLGEAALTRADADRYFAAYRGAIAAVGQRGGRPDEPLAAPSVSVKLSALSPRYEIAQGHRAAEELGAMLLELAKAARDAGVGITVDAEEADRLELSLAIFTRVFCNADLADYSGLGLAVQAYQKRALPTLNALKSLADGAARTGRVLPVRLVKGAYWDTEIKRAQELGLVGYPVFTRKVNTDVSYLAAARSLLEHPRLYPQFATHNAHTVAWILEAGANRRFEFQRLHGMGEELYAELLERRGGSHRCRVYAPVGTHEHLLPYLVRRLLENGANTSFVNRLIDADAPAASLVANPLDRIGNEESVANPRIPLPPDLYEPERKNSRGRNLSDAQERATLVAALDSTQPGQWRALPCVNGAPRPGQPHDVLDPADRRRYVGSVEHADAATAAEALKAATEFQPRWSNVAPERRAQLLRRAAELVEADAAELVARCVAEAGRTVPDALAEVREAVDLLRYYAAQVVRVFAPSVLPGPTGERNVLALRSRGPFVCISPWNFPLSIFVGQVAAALGAGNTAIAKPAEQASLTAARMVELLLQAGIPGEALHFLPGDGAALGGALLGDDRVAGVVFTGSVETAHAINRRLARRAGALATLIAETGGINALIADSSALPEQVVRDAVYSAFDSAGQRCSALRLLCLQDDTADEVLRMLRGYMEELVIGDPALLSTDVGPVIDEQARAALLDYIENHRGAILHQCRLDSGHEHGLFVPPTLLGLPSAAALTREIFGPVLHVVRYRAADAARLVDEINANGYGLTLGVHTRIDAFAKFVAGRARVGNVYVNRNMIGAQVGVQPFGGMGLSGTGPKTGGPAYLPRFTVEQTVTTNTAAVGGNATLLSLGADEVTAPST